MLEFLGELVFDGGELGDGEGGEVDCEWFFVYQYEDLRPDIGRIVFVLGWDCCWVGASLEVMLVEGLYFVVLKLYSTREHPPRASGYLILLYSRLPYRFQLSDMPTPPVCGGHGALAFLSSGSRGPGPFSHF